MSYHDLAYEVYGSACEFVGCGWHAGPCDVHHINYQLQQFYEKQIRAAQKTKDVAEKENWIEIAKSNGFLQFDEVTKQLAKDDRSVNLAVVCPNHHRYIHHLDLGNDVLRYIGGRK